MRHPKSEKKKKKIRTSEIKKKPWKEKRKRMYFHIDKFVIPLSVDFMVVCAR